MAPDHRHFVDEPPFEFDCSQLPFDAETYMILARQGRRLDLLIRGCADPSTDSEDYFVRCVRHDADYDSHQCLAADAWRQLVERRRFEAEHCSPDRQRAWLRGWELRAGMILLLPGRTELLLTKSAPEICIQDNSVYYRNRTNLPWHGSYFSEGGQYWEATSLRAKRQSEVLIHRDEIIMAVDGGTRIVTFLDWNGSDDMLIRDNESHDTFFIPTDRVSWDFLAVWPQNVDSQIRVQWWDGAPIWAWGPA